jgi:hypothetical protein
MTHKPSEEEKLFRLSDALVNDLMTLSDGELLRESKDDGGDPEAMAAEVRDALQAMVMHESKTRLAKARQSLDTARAVRLAGNLLSLPLPRKQQILGQFAANDGRLRERLTMAARKGDGASEREVDDILQDLRDLGAIDDEGNPR